MDINSNYIITKFYEFENDKKTLSVYQLENKHEEFIKKYPKIWISFIDKIFNIQQFKELVDIRDKVFEKNKNLDYKDKRFYSDIEVGEKLAREFLYPSTGEPSKKQKSAAYSKLLAKTKKKQDNVTVEQIEQMENISLI